MSQDVRNNRIALKPSAGEIPNQPWSMNAAADRLMDDVFSEVDLMMKSGGEAYTAEPAKPEYISLQEIKIPRVNVPPTMQPRPSQPAASNSAPKAAKTQKSSGGAFEKLLLIAACASLGVTLLLWLASQGRFNGLFGATPRSNTGTAKTVAPGDTQFIDYMQRSLDRLEQKSDVKQEAAAPEAPKATNNSQLPVPFPGNLPAIPSRQTVLERVYIPVSPRIQTNYISPPAPAKPGAKPSPGAKTQSAAPKPAALRATIRPTNTAPIPLAPIPIPWPAPIAARPASPTAAPRPVTASRSVVPAPAPRPRQVASRPVAPSPRPTVAARVAPSPRPTVAARVAPSPRPTVAARVAPSPRPTVAARVAPSPQSTPVATRAAAPSPQPTAAVTRRRLRPQAAPSPVAAAPAAVSQPTARQESAQAAAPASSIRLNGLLNTEGNSKDAALFELNGVTRRVYAGEGIGSSGWTLVEVNDREAVIRRNGDVRSVSVGEQF